MKAKISVTMPAIVSGLVMIGALSAGMAAYQAYEQRQRSESFLEVNHISQLLVRSSGQWAVERGLTNAPLKSPWAVSGAPRDVSFGAYASLVLGSRSTLAFSGAYVALTIPAAYRECSSVSATTTAMGCPS